jgi:uncharacterized protein YjiS (DUF1127 family)
VRNIQETGQAYIALTRKTWLKRRLLTGASLQKEKAVTMFALSRGWSRSAVASNPILFAVLVVSRRIRRKLKVRADRSVLQGMPDHLLSDIGISRSEIDSATHSGRNHPFGPNYRLNRMAT